MYICTMKLQYLILSAIFFALTGCLGQSSTYHKCEGAVWATSYHITYRSDKMLDDSIIAVMSQVEMSLSPFEEESTVSLINNGQSTLTDTLLRRIFLASQSICRISRGAFDPTLAPVVNLWGFGYHKGVQEPTQAQIDSAMQGVGILRCSLEGNKLIKSENTEFNFSAITKGYGCDLIGEMLQRNGCTDYMIEIGGEVAVMGKNPHGKPWHIMVDAPLANDTAVVHERMAVVAVTDCGIATSGNYRNYRNIRPGMRVGHTIDAFTGRPVATSTLSATVIAQDAMTADALATACMAMPVELALKMIGTLPDTEALIVTADSTGTKGWQLHTTPGFPELM